MGKVLVIDDDLGITRLLERLIIKNNHECIVARDGLEGLQKIRDEKPQLVITDLRMPDLGGLELTRLVKADPQTSHIPIVILSGNAQLLDKNEVLADEILPKPFDLRAVYELLNRFLYRPANDNYTPTNVQQQNYDQP